MYYYSMNYLIHHGVKGQKWGVRRYQNEDGSLKNNKGVHLDITPKFAIASGTAFLGGAGATLLARKLVTNSFIPVGKHVHTGVRGIHPYTDVGKAVATALVAGGIGALTVASIKTIHDSNNKEVKS